MPGLSWSSLKVVACDGVVGQRGTALRTPVLQDENGRFLLPSRVEDETVTPRPVLRQDEVRELLEGGVWIPVRSLPARRGHLVVLRTASFKEACWRVDIGEDLRWEDHVDGVDVAYVLREAAVRWRARCAERFVKSAGNRIGEHLAAPGASGLLARAQMILEQALFVANQGTPTRQRVFVLLGVVLTELESPSWSRMAVVALSERPGLDQRQLDEEVEAARRELKAHKERSRPRAWVGEYQQRLQPPGL